MLLTLDNKRSSVRTDIPGNAWHAIPAKEVVARIGSAQAGLTAAEAVRRLALDGPHRIPAPRQPGIIGDPTEGAVVAISSKAGFDAAAGRRKCPRFDKIPFKSDRRLGGDPPGKFVGPRSGRPSRLIRIKARVRPIWCSARVVGSSVDPPPVVVGRSRGTE